MQQCRNNHRIIIILKVEIRFLQVFLAQPAQHCHRRFYIPIGFHRNTLSAKYRFKQRFHCILMKTIIAAPQFCIITGNLWNPRNRYQRGATFLQHFINIFSRFPDIKQEHKCLGYDRAIVLIFRNTFSRFQIPFYRTLTPPLYMETVSRLQKILILCVMVKTE